MQQPEPQTPSFTVGEADNAIVLGAGIAEGGVGVQTRAVDEETRHNKHVAFSTTNHTELRLRVDGTWLGKSNNSVSQQTSATTGNETATESKHNSLSFSPTLYWDDYGSADPNNMSIDKGGNVEGNTDGRGKGLTIYGVAVNEKSLPTAEVEGRAKLSEVSSWTSIAWNVGEPSDGVIDQSTNGWGNYDLLTSNNIRESGDGTYKFDDFLADKKNGTTTSISLLEFTHAMSKVTFVLTAGDGFPLENTWHKFESTPKVTLTSRVTGDTTTDEWAQTKGTVNAETGAVSLATYPEKASIKMHHSGTDATTKKVTLDALIFPGSVFADKGSNANDPYPVIARIEADGNIYYITTEKIRAAITSKYTAGNELEFKTQPGINYIFNVTINKTEIKVTATIADWVTVTAEEAPKINISADWGSASSGTNNLEGFSFYRSLALYDGYSFGLSTNANNYFAAEAIAQEPTTVGAQWVFNDGTNNISLYWPNHSTHYQFRGVWPKTSTLTTDVTMVPHVKALNAGTDETQIIGITNVPYNSGSYPSDLMIARPEFGIDSEGNEIDPDCTNSDHTHKKLYSEGICATEGLVTMNFRYVMSQVEVVLSTSDAGSKNRVNLNENTIVEIVNVYNNGYVKLGDRKVVGTDSKGNYTLDLVTGGGNELKRHSAIVPQTLTYTTAGAETNVRFKITVTNDDAVLYANATEYNAAKSTSLNDSEFEALTVEQKTKTPATKDIYFADIKPISYTYEGGSGAYDTNGSWNSGVHYKYNLKLTKTEIKVTATITDWVTVNASEDVWF